MNFLHSFLLTVKMGSEFSLFSATSLAVSKIDPTEIVSSRKRSCMISSLSPSIMYHHILPLSRLREISEIALRTSWHPGNGDFFVTAPLLTFPTKASNLFCVGRKTQIYKNWIINGGENWG